MDLVGALLWRVARPVNRGLMARLWWARERRRGDFSMSIVDRMVGRGDVVLDIGANFGMFTYRLAHLTGKGGEVHAFEPHPGQRENLRRVEAAHPNVTVYLVALSDSPGTAELTVPRVGGEPDLALATLAPRAGDERELERVEVPVETLDGVLARARRPVSFIKCDVEGHERSVFEGGRRLLAADRPTLLVEIEQRHQEHDIRETFEWIQGLGYEGYAVRDRALAPVSSFDVERDQLDFVRADPEAAAMPPGYVNDFLFVSRERNVALPAPVTGSRSSA